MIRTAVSAALVVAMVSAPAFAEPSTTVFPLAAPNLPMGIASAPEELSEALSDAIDATVAKVPIDDAAGLLECDPEAKSCLTKVAKQYKSDRLVFGTIEMVDESKLKISLTRFDTDGAEREQRTFTVDGEVDEMAKQLVKLSKSLFSDDTSTPDDPGEGDGPELGGGGKKDDPTGGGITTTTWGILGVGGATLVVGGAFLYSSSSIANDVATAPRKTESDFTKLKLLEDKGSQRRVIGGVLTTVGAAAVIWGVVRAISEKSAPAPEPSAVSHFSPLPLQGGGGLVFTMEMP